MQIPGLPKNRFTAVVEHQHSRAEDDQAVMIWILLVLFGEASSAPNPSAAAEAQNIAAVRLASEGRYEEAEGLFRAALGAKYDDDLIRAKIAQNLGSIYQRQDRYRDAESMFRLALQWRQKNLPAASVEIAYSLNNLADMYRIEGRNWEAQSLLETAVRSVQQFHPDAPGLPRILNTLALVRNNFNQFDEAEELLRAAMVLCQRQGTTTLEYGVTLNNLGQVLQTRNDLNAAASLYAQAIAIFGNLGTQATGYLASALANSGMLYLHLGRIEEALQAEQRALGLLRPTGNEALRATILRNLGIIAASRGSAADSLHYFEESLTIQEKILGAEHPGTADLLQDYASAAMRAGNKSLSRKLRRRAKELLARLSRQSPEDLTVSVRALQATE
jgi:tetratricopeptide (TPR) repeat protein